MQRYGEPELFRSCGQLEDTRHDDDRRAPGPEAGFRLLAAEHLDTEALVDGECPHHGAALPVV